MHLVAAAATTTTTIAQAPAAIGSGLNTWLNGTGLHLALILATVSTVVFGARGKWHRAMEVVGGTLLGLFILGIASGPAAVGHSLSTMF